jgi:Plasmid pRiA4b ORF-3-like protein
VLAVQPARCVIAHVALQIDVRVAFSETPGVPMAIRKARKNLLRRRELKPLDYALRISIDGITPPIYRDVLVSEKLFLIQLHRTIQATFGWFDVHDHEFVADGVRYAEPDDDGRLAHGVRSTMEITVGELALNTGSNFTYTYDFGDRWKHTITVIDIFDSETPEMTVFPMLIGGERAGPPEDSGGAPGYAEMLAIVADPNHPQHQERAEWLGAPYDPEQFDFRQSMHALILMCSWGAI